METIESQRGHEHGLYQGYRYRIDIEETQLDQFQFRGDVWLRAVRVVYSNLKTK